MGKKVNVKALIGIFVFCFGAMASNMTMGIMAYISQSYADSPQAVIQTILVTPSLVSVIYALFVGKLNTKIPAKMLVIIHQIGILAYGLIFLLLGGVASIYVLIVGAGLLGFAQGSNYTLLGLLLADVVKDEKQRATWTGICTSIMSVGGVVITTVGGFIAVSRWQNAYLLFLYFIIAIVLEFILLPNVKPEGSVQAKPEAGAAPGAEAAAAAQAKGGMGRVWAISIHYLFFFMFLYVFGTNVSEFIINTYKLGTSAEAGFAASCVTIGGIFAGALFGLYSTRFLKKFTVPFMMLLSVIGLGLPVFMTTSVVGIYFCGILLGFAMNGCAPYIMEELHNAVPAAQYGKAMSIYSAFMNAGMLIAIYVITFLTQLVCGDGNNIHYKFVVAAVGVIICFVTSLPIYLSKGKKKA
ncbi:MAG TPA: MFS transporter [Candidatus Scatomonas pullistercoris]|uniref:MFS transporter n=1 Tax=Candidatus Scatomonas pullistercoris TaxID=2840920 RepID=A0A9D1P2M2_9FIRM|nr:MFS transporter [Candidatus Scatomonas pullistercoris]